MLEYAYTPPCLAVELSGLTGRTCLGVKVNLPPVERFLRIAYPMCRCNYLRFLKLQGVSVSVSESQMRAEQQIERPVTMAEEARNHASGRISRSGCSKASRARRSMKP